MDLYPIRQTLEGTKVLLAEDNIMNRRLAEELMHHVGISVECAGDGREVLLMVATERYDLILMDIQMPLLDGYETTKALRADPRWSRLPIVAMSAHTLNENRERSLSLGMNDHLTKPIDTEQLYAALMRWIKPHASPVENIKSNPPSNPVACLAHCIEVQELLDRVNHRSELLRMVLTEFVHSYAQADRKISAWLIRGHASERTSAHRLAHSIKGMAGNLSAKRLFQAAWALEQALLQPATAIDASPLEKEFSRALTEVVESIALWEKSNR